MHSLPAFSDLHGKTVENFCILRLTTGVRHAILTVLTHLIQQEPMFHLIFLIPVLVVLLLGILLLAVLCSR